MTDTQRPPQPDKPQPTGLTSISGGVNIDAQRDVHIGGDVVGRDKIDQIGGDKVEGDKIEGDKIIIDQRRQISRTVIQIGQFNLPLMPLLAGGGIALAILLFISLNVARLNQVVAPTPTPGPMSSATFNVVVAEFGAIDANGKVRVTDQSHSLSQTVYETLLAQREAFPDPIIKSSIAIRYGNLPVPDNLIDTADTADRIVKQIGADMLIYGNLDQSGDFEPQFYLSPKVRGDIDALLTGNQGLGMVNIAPGASFGASTDVRMRASALFFIATGLTYDAFGRAGRSLDVYRQAEQVLSDWPEQGAGKEVLYFFKGQAALFRAQQVTGPTSDDLLNEAEAAFQNAINSNATYGRAHIGLGSATYVRIQRAPAISETLDSPEMQMMLAEYDRGVELARAAGDQLGEQVGIYSQGTGAYQLGRAYRDSDLSRANGFFATAIERISSTVGPFATLGQPRLVAQAYLALGAIRMQQAAIAIGQGDRAGGEAAYRAAREAYQQCLAQAAGSADRVLTDLIGRDRCQPQLDRIEQILAAQ